MEDIKTLPPVERPREKMQLLGPQALSDAELLAILFGKGNRNLPVSKICDDLLEQLTLKDLPEADVKQLCATKGIGAAKALTLLAVVEIAKRLTSVPLLRLLDQEAVAAHVRPVLTNCDGLSYLLLLMTADRDLLAICELGSVLPDLPRALRLATESGARRVQLVRNGRLQFSRTEYQFMRNLELACGTLGIIAYEMLAVIEGEFKMMCHEYCNLYVGLCQIKPFRQRLYLCLPVS
jgi:DNA repair protein RadC